MLDLLIRILKSIRRKCADESDLIRGRHPRVLSPDVRRALKRLQQDCEDGSAVKTDAE